MARRPHHSKRPEAPKVRPARGWRGNSFWSLAGAALLVGGIGALIASLNGWPPFGPASNQAGVSLAPSRTGIPLPTATGTVAIFPPAPNATGKSEASPHVLACIEGLHINNDVLQPMRRDLDFQIWRNPEYSSNPKTARYQFLLRDQILRSHDAKRLIAEVRTCTALE